MTAREEYEHWSRLISDAQGVPPKTIALADAALAEADEQIAFKDKALDGMHAQLREAEDDYKTVAEACESQGEYIAELLAKLAQAEAEVTRLKWMLHEAYGDWLYAEPIPEPTEEEWLADLERRWAERRGEK